MTKKSLSRRRKKKTGPPNSNQHSPTQIEYPFKDQDMENGDKVFIECPGATIYQPGTKRIIAGVSFNDDSNPDMGYKIIGNQVFAPEHKGRRLIKKEHLGSIRRCQACQDLTVRMIRREGPDFFIPNPRHPNKKQLKSIDRIW